MRKFQVVIAGGGVAGLTAAIHLSKIGIETILIERHQYPHHKVCGEYLSREVSPYFKELKVDLNQLKPPEINKLEYSTSGGRTIKADLEMGGYGISRYNLDNFLYKKAKENGCEFHFDTITKIIFSENCFEIKTQNGNNFQSDFVIGAFGKRSNLDKFLKRNYLNANSGWLGVKAHYKNDSYPSHLVSLHNFQGGYCGLSKTEMDTINVCYLATYNSFKKFKNAEDFQHHVLKKNEQLNDFFASSEKIFEKEVTIAQINFAQKTAIENHIIMIGDAAGLIYPLCGNGMAMGIHSAKIAVEIIANYYSDKNVERSELENRYTEIWNSEFHSRLRMGRILQKVLMNDQLANISQKVIGAFPGILPKIIAKTHGKPIV